MCLTEAVKRPTILFLVWKLQGLNFGNETCPAGVGFPYLLKPSWTVMVYTLQQATTASFLILPKSIFANHSALRSDTWHHQGVDNIQKLI